MRILHVLGKQQCSWLIIPNQPAVSGKENTGLCVCLCGCVHDDKQVLTLRRHAHPAGATVTLPLLAVFVCTCSKTARRARREKKKQVLFQLLSLFFSSGFFSQVRFFFVITSFSKCFPLKKKLFSLFTVCKLPPCTKGRMLDLVREWLCVSVRVHGEGSET